MFKRMSAAAAVAAICLVSAQSVAQDEQVLDTDQKKYSYALGTMIGQQILDQFGQANGEIDLEAFRGGIDAILAGRPSQLSAAEITEIIQMQQQAQLEAERKAMSERKALGDQYRETNKADPEVVVTDSGLQYKPIAEGPGDGASPTVDDTVVVHYQGTLVDGTVFDSSYQRGQPATFPLNAVIPGWTEVLQLMRPGDKWSVVIPPELAYGESGAGGVIGPNETLLFDVELIEIQ